MSTATSKKAKAITKEDIISRYMNQVLETEKFPASVFKFCKENKIEEQEFYKYFGSFEALQKSVWYAFFEQAMKAMGQSKEYANFERREKLLTFYFTFFEILTLNRSYVLFALHRANSMESNLMQLSDLSTGFKEYLREINDSSDMEGNNVRQISAKAVEEFGWAQFMVILRFWMKDSSPAFEKTDVMIEKTINTTFDLADIKPVRSIIDLAKFLIKEKAFI